LPGRTVTGMPLPHAAWSSLLPPQDGMLGRFLFKIVKFRAALFSIDPPLESRCSSRLSSRTSLTMSPVFAQGPQFKCDLGVICHSILDTRRAPPPIVTGLSKRRAPRQSPCPQSITANATIGSWVWPTQFGVPLQDPRKKIRCVDFEA